MSYNKIPPRWLHCPRRGQPVAGERPARPRRGFVAAAAPAVPGPFRPPRPTRPPFSDSAGCFVPGPRHRVGREESRAETRRRRRREQRGPVTPAPCRASRSTQCCASSPRRSSGLELLPRVTAGGNGAARGADGPSRVRRGPRASRLLPGSAPELGAAHGRSSACDPRRCRQCWSDLCAPVGRRVGVTETLLGW